MGEFLLPPPGVGQEDEDIKIVIGIDLSPKAERVAAWARKTKGIIGGMSSSRDVSIRRSDSRFFVDHVPCIQPVTNHIDHFYLKFKDVTFSKKDRDSIKEALESQMASSIGGAEWVSIIFA